MKKLIVLLSLLVSQASFSAETVEQKAFAALISLNPKVELYDGRQGTLAEAIAPYILSVFDDQNKGSIGLVHNECTLENNEYVCHLRIDNADYDMNDEGDYIKPEDGLESGVVIIYKLDKALKKIKEYRLFYAG